MRKYKHTPGPWSAFIANSTLAIDIGPVPLGTRPCVVDWGGFDGSDLPIRQRRANAILIAAAPDLLEALAAILSNEGDPMFTAPTKEQYEFARQAIKKATGETE